MNIPVLLVGNFLSSSGWTTTVCEELAQHLSAAGWSVFTTSHKRRRIQRLFDMVTTVVKKRREYGVAHVDVYSGAAFFWAEAVCAVLLLLKKPYVLSLHGGNLPVFAGRWPSRVRRLLRRANAVTTPSSYLHDRMACYRADLKLLPNALNLGSYKFRLRDNPKPVILWMRAFHEIYNPVLAVRVLASLRRDFPAIHLTMLGPDRGDGSFQATKDVARSLGVLDRLDLPGLIPKSEVPHWLEKADVFLNTTNIDNAPVSVLEAMACGLCVVSTDAGGVPYILKSEDTGLLVSPNDLEGTTNAVRRILTDPELARRVSRNARMRVEEFNWSNILPRWEELLQTVGAERWR